MSWLLLAISGAAGAIGRVALSDWFVKRLKTARLPFGTIFVNGVGSLCLGLLTGWGIQQSQSSFFLYAGTGFLGAFTTFSTFSLDAVQLVRERKYGKVLLYVSITFIGSFVLYSAGFLIMGGAG